MLNKQNRYESGITVAQYLNYLFYTVIFCPSLSRVSILSGPTVYVVEFSQQYEMETCVYCFVV